MNLFDKYAVQHTDIVVFVKNITTTTSIWYSEEKPDVKFGIRRRVRVQPVYLLASLSFRIYSSRFIKLSWSRKRGLDIEIGYRIEVAMNQ